MAARYAAVALQIEDYYDTVATTPMSSVSVQFLFYGYTAPSVCSTPPTIIGVRPNRGDKIKWIFFSDNCVHLLF